MRSQSRNWPERCWLLLMSKIPQRGRSGASAALRSFSARRVALRAALLAVQAAMKRAAAARNRLQARRARHDTRSWQVKRRERTRQLIELGGLVAKAGLIELTDDDRAVIFGLLVEAAARLRTEQREQALALWRRRGRRAFAAATAE